MTSPTLSLWPGGRPLAVTFSFDDGTKQDLRLAELLTRHGLRATFNVHTAETGTNPAHLDETELGDPIFDPHEISLHSHTHPFLTALPDIGVLEEMRENRLRLERATGRMIRGSAYPFGDFDARVAGICRMVGACYGRTVDATGRFDAPHPGADWMRWHPTCHERELTAAMWEEFLEYKMWHRLPRLLFLWGHSWEFDEPGGWERIERRCAELAPLVSERIWAATNLEIHDYLTAQAALRFSADRQRVHNPTRVDCWLRLGTHAFALPAGGTTDLRNL